MNHQAKDPNVTLEDIEKTLQESFPEHKFTYQKPLLTGKVLIVGKTKTVGVGVTIKNGTITTRDAIPSPVMMGLMASFGLLGFGIIKLANRKKWKQLHADVESHIVQKH